MKNRAKVIAILTLAALIAPGCAGRKAAAGYSTTTPSEIEDLIKKEYATALYAVGSADAPKADMAERKAEMQARAALAREFESQVSQLQKSYEESVNKGAVEEYSQVMEVFASVKLENVKVVKSMVKPENNGMVTAKVLVAISASDFRNAIDNKLASFTSFRASKAYEELEDRVKEVTVQ